MPLTDQGCEIDEEGIGRKHIDLQLGADDGEEDEGGEYDNEEIIFKGIGGALEFAYAIDHGSEDKEGPRLSGVGKGDEIVPERAFVVEGIDGSAYCLVNEEIIEIFSATFSVDSPKP